MTAPTERVQVIKRESLAGGGDPNDDTDYSSPIDPNEDVVEAAGFALQDTITRDLNVITWRASGAMMFKDEANPSGLTLTQLAATSTGLTYTEFLLDNEPTAETGATDCVYTITRTSGHVSKEEWKRNDTTLIKSIDYTYTTGRITTEIRRVFDTNGTTVLAQVTWVYTYAGGLLISATMTRNV